MSTSQFGKSLGVLNPFKTGHDIQEWKVGMLMPI